MRFVTVVAVLAGLCFGIAGHASSNAASLVAGRFDVPPVLVPKIAHSVITSLYGVALGNARADGGFSLPPSPVDDIEILFVRSRATDDTILLGIADGGSYEIGVTGTALALLLMSDPAHGALPPAAKRALLQQARQSAEFPALTEAVQAAILDGHVTAGNGAGDGRLAALLDRMQGSLSRGQPSAIPPGAGLPY